jgi:hypothetical protein
MAESNEANAFFGFSVATAGDVNGDGYSDVIAGSPGWNGQAGGTFVWLGSIAGLGPDGTPANADWSAESDQQEALFGSSAAAAGDVNGDGYSDVIVGAFGYDNPPADGAAFLYYGNAGPGLSMRPQQRCAGDGGPIDHLGRAHHETDFRLAQIGRSPLGRGRVKIECEIKPLGVTFDGTNLQQSSVWIDTGTTGASMSELFSITMVAEAQHWRMRTLYHAATSPFQQRGRWVSTHGNAWNEADLRMLSTAASSDVDGDGDFDVDDLVLVILNWGACAGCICVGDLNGDGAVDVDDLIAVILSWS